MFSLAPNIVFAPNMMQNAERKHRPQDTNTAHFQSLRFCNFLTNFWTFCQKKILNKFTNITTKILYKNDNKFYIYL